MARPDPRALLCAHQHARGALPVRTIPTETDPARRFEPLAREARRAFVERVLRPVAESRRDPHGPFRLGGSG